MAEAIEVRRQPPAVEHRVGVDELRTLELTVAPDEALRRIARGLPTPGDHFIERQTDRTFVVSWQGHTDQDSVVIEGSLGGHELGTTLVLRARGLSVRKRSKVATHSLALVALVDALILREPGEALVWSVGAFVGLFGGGHLMSRRKRRQRAGEMLALVESALADVRRPVGNPYR